MVAIQAHQQRDFLRVLNIQVEMHDCVQFQKIRMKLQILMDQIIPI